MTRPLFPDIVVNGTTLSAAAIAAEAQNHAAPRGKPGLAWRKAARALAIRQLLLDEADRLGIAGTPEELAPGKTESPEEARIREVLSRCVTPAPVSEAALRAAYARNPDACRAPSLYQPAHILFPAPPGDAEARSAARARAEKALAEVRKAPRSFGEMAREESACASRDAEGQLGQLASGDTVPEFETALRAAPVGEIHGALVETRYGFHILRLDARAEGEVLPFDAVRGRLQEASEKANWAAAAQAFVADLLARADIRGLDLEAEV